MKIQVVRTDGAVEVLNLGSGDWTILEGQFLNRLAHSSGVEHWFNRDGLYDGWGAATAILPAGGAKVIIETMEEKREIKPQGDVK